MQQDTNDTRTTRSTVLAGEAQMSAARTKQRKEDKHTGIRKEKKRKVGSKAKKQENRMPTASIVTMLPVSAAKPSRETCQNRTYYILRDLVDSGVKCHYCRCSLSSPPSVNKSTKSKQNNQDTGGLCEQLRFHFLVELVPCHTISHSISAFVDRSISTATPPASSLDVTLGVLCATSS